MRLPGEKIGIAVENVLRAPLIEDGDPHVDLHALLVDGLDGDLQQPLFPGSLGRLQPLLGVGVVVAGPDAVKEEDSEVVGPEQDPVHSPLLPDPGRLGHFFGSVELSRPLPFVLPDDVPPAQDHELFLGLDGKDEKEERNSGQEVHFGHCFFPVLSSLQPLCGRRPGDGRTTSRRPTRRPHRKWSGPRGVRRPSPSTCPRRW